MIRITVSSGSIQSFGLTAGTDTTINSAGAGYTFGTVNLGDDFIFSDSSLSSSTTLGAGSGGAIEVIISPKEGHGNDATHRTRWTLCDDCNHTQSAIRGR